MNLDGGRGRKCLCPSGYRLTGLGATCKLVSSEAAAAGSCRSPARPRFGHYRCSRRRTGADALYPAGTRCKLKCRRGYRPSPVNARQKCRDGRWDGPDGGVLCEPATGGGFGSSAPKPYIVCPADVTKLLADTRSTSAYVMFPQPKTNVDWFR